MHPGSQSGRRISVFDLYATLERQLGQGWTLLKFHPALEPSFREDYEERVRSLRTVLLVVAIILVATTPLVDALILHPPEAFAKRTHLLQLGIMVPVIVLALAANVITRLRYIAVPLALLTLAIVASGVIYQRHLGAQYSYHVPAELANVVIAGAFIMGGVRFWRVLPLALLVLGAMIWNEFSSYGINSASHYTINASVMLTLIVGTAGYAQEYQARGNWLRHKMLEQLAARDSLTGLLNTRSFHDGYNQTFQLAMRNAKPLLVAIVDIDCFKEYNDYYGHAAGDNSLKQVVKIIEQQAQRDSDLKARIGGEEFAVVCYDIDESKARQLLEDLRQNIESLRIPHHRSRVSGEVVTVSIGAIWLIPTSGTSTEEILHTADTRLYQSKRAGRNRVTFE